MTEHNGYIPEEFKTPHTAKGEQLHNYTTRQVSDDGTYEIVTTHTETIQRIPQPLTEEEKAAQAKADRIGLIVLGTLGTAFMAVVGWAIWQDEKSSRAYEKERMARYTKPSTDEDGPETSL